MSLEDFKSYEETAYLMSSPKNAERLNQAIAEVEAGKSREHRIVYKATDDILYIVQWRFHY